MIGQIHLGGVLWPPSDGAAFLLLASCWIVGNVERSTRGSRFLGNLIRLVEDVLHQCEKSLFHVVAVLG